MNSQRMTLSENDASVFMSAFYNAIKSVVVYYVIFGILCTIKEKYR